MRAPRPRQEAWLERARLDHAEGSGHRKAVEDLLLQAASLRGRLGL